MRLRNLTHSDFALCLLLLACQDIVAAEPPLNATADPIYIEAAHGDAIGSSDSPEEGGVAAPGHYSITSLRWTDCQGNDIQCPITRGVGVLFCVEMTVYNDDWLPNVLDLARVNLSYDDGSTHLPCDTPGKQFLPYDHVTFTCGVQEGVLPNKCQFRTSGEVYDDGVLVDREPTSGWKTCNSPSGTACGGSSTDCDALDTCNGTGSCIDRVAPKTKQCRAAGPVPACDPAEFCDGTSKTCPANVYSPAGIACGSFIIIDCDALDTCDGHGNCIDNVAPPATQCRPAGPVPACDPAEFCNGTSKTCPPNAYSPAGTACPSDGNECTNDVCNGGGLCTHPNKPEGSSCDDGQYCTIWEACWNGSCGDGLPRTCSGGDQCNEPYCDEATDQCRTRPKPNGTPCDDGQYCTTGETCQGGSCSGSTPRICSGGQCCYEETDSCAPCPPPCTNQPNGTPCTDDGNPCTDDICNGGQCTHPPNSASCNDGMYCNGADTCAGGSCSIHAGSPCPSGQCCTEATDSCAACPCPDDGNPCTDEVYVNNQCTHPNNTKPCNDGLYCNGADTCGGGSCSVHAGNPCPVGQCCTEATDLCAACPCPDDGNPCTDEVYVNNQCTHPNNSNACDDGVFCNGEDTCRGGSCSVHSGNPCNPPSSCDETAHGCRHDGCVSDGDCASSEWCDDADDTCQARCSGGTAPAPPSGVSATGGTFEDQIRVTWNSVPGATEYKVYQCGDCNSPASTCTPKSAWQTTRTFDDRSCNAPGTCYRVRARTPANCVSSLSSCDCGSCGQDSDGDGVPDSRDDCPRTPPGEDVDSNGCASFTVTIHVAGPDEPATDSPRQREDSRYRACAPAYDGWQFVEWTSLPDDAAPSLEGNCVFLTMDADKSLSVSYKPVCVPAPSLCGNGGCVGIIAILVGWMALRFVGPRGNRCRGRNG